MSFGQFLILGADLAFGETIAPTESVGEFLLLTAAALGVLGVIGAGAKERRILVGMQYDADGKPKVFTLSYGAEMVTLHPGKNWIKADEYKWVTRGLIEPPQSFHVLPTGAVEINGEKVSLTDPEAISKLEHEINKTHVPAPAHRPVAAATGPAATAHGAPVRARGKVHFHVKLDSLGHLAIECARGSEQLETGLRGLQNLIVNGLMLRPNTLHVDALQRAVEIDGVRFECTEAGAQQLEEVLNAHYAPTVGAEHESPIEIKENPAAATGFDLRFVTVKAGARIEIKGHLNQERLDILQDPAKCDLLQPGIMLRLSPPNLLIRRRRPDGGEEHLPELPDIQYRRVTALQLQQLLNHPLIRRASGSASLQAAVEELEPPAELVELRVVRNPQDPLLLWLECLTTRGGAPKPKALTHHNIADLQQDAVFQPHLDVVLSLDNQTLGILDKRTGEEAKLTINSESPDEALREAGRRLTAALKPPSLPPTMRPAAPPPPLPSEVLAASSSASTTPGHPQLASPPPVAPHREPAPSPAPPRVSDLAPPPSVATPSGAPPRVTATPLRLAPPTAQVRPVQPPPPPAAPAATPPHPILAWFRETDPVRINLELFRRLGPLLGLPVQDVRLTLPRAFENRRFEVLSFSHPEIVSILDLRSEGFYGFYLSHINEQKILLVYARKGRHLEWGPQRCLLQPAVTAEPDEFKGSGLLGMAQDHNKHCVFIVTPQYRDWAKAHARPYQEIFVEFITPETLGAELDKYHLVWPAPPA